MEGGFTGKLFIITGSAGGLGRAFAVKLLECGAKVCISDIKEEAGLATEKHLQETFGAGNVAFVHCDVTREESVTHLWDEAERLLGRPVFCMVNNAGVMGEKEGWRMCMEINLTGVLHGTTLALRRLSKSEGGVGGIVVNIASILGLFCGTQPKDFQYNTSKSAVVTLSRCLGNSSTYSSTGVRVVCLCPSVAQTPILEGCSQDEIHTMSKQVGGLMSPEFVASAFLELVESGANGSVMAVWNKVPPYYIPDTGMALFVFCTTCAMMLRWVPGVKVVKIWMMPFCLALIFLSWYLGAQGMSWGYRLMLGDA